MITSHSLPPDSAPDRLPRLQLPLAPGQELIPGILGGMGPLPHIHLERLLLQKMRERGVTREQEYPTWFVMNAAPMPDRTACILNGTEDCVKDLVASGTALANAGAHFLVVVCNTAHAFRAQSAEQIPIPWVDLLKVVALELKTSPDPIRKIGILATDGTIATGLYPQALAALGVTEIEALYPSPTLQRGVMQAIYNQEYGIKSQISLTVTPEAIDRFEAASRELLAAGADVIITACTEISLCSRELRERGIPIIDPLDALADTMIGLTYGELNIGAFT